MLPRNFFANFQRLLFGKNHIALLPFFLLYIVATATYLDKQSNFTSLITTLISQRRLYKWTGHSTLTVSSYTNSNEFLTLGKHLFRHVKEIEWSVYIFAMHWVNSQKIQILPLPEIVERGQNPNFIKNVSWLSSFLGVLI